MAIVRGLAVNFDAGSDHCCVIEIAVEQGGDVVESRVIQQCDKPVVATWFGAGLCSDHQRQLQGERGWSMN
jgi:hypothetical protein